MLINILSRHNDDKNMSVRYRSDGQEKLLLRAELSDYMKIMTCIYHTTSHECAKQNKSLVHFLEK